jgi:hypothetical protein
LSFSISCTSFGFRGEDLREVEIVV